MTAHWFGPLAFAALTAAATLALGQANVPPFPPAPPASAPRATPPGPRVLTPTEQRDSATTPGDLRPEEKVTPQVVIPLRKVTPPTKAERAAARRGRTAPSGTIDDAAARCEAQSSASARASCRDRLRPADKTKPR